jgi:hypothetical protein
MVPSIHVSNISTLQYISVQFLSARRLNQQVVLPLEIQPVMYSPTVFYAEASLTSLRLLSV